MKNPCTGAFILVLLMWTIFFMGPGCAPVEKPETDPAASSDRIDFAGSLQESPAPQEGWRGHFLRECDPENDLPSKVEELLALSLRFFQEGSGSDGMIELEMALEAGTRHSLIDVTLGQLYLLAGQGEPSLLPVEGPAADVGNWEKNRTRLLARARKLLYRAQGNRPSDGVVDYLLADVARAQGDRQLADNLAELAAGKCLGGRSLEFLRLYQQLNRYPARYLGGASPQFPEDALAQGVGGDVSLDLLLDPAGRIRQAMVLESPHPSLTRSAFKALQEGQFEAGRVGKYPVWCWIQVTISFNLES